MQDTAEHTGGTFYDTDEALDTMQKYAALLELQQQADGMTDEEYVAALDRISGGDLDGFLAGAWAYGDNDELAQYRQAVEDATEERVKAAGDDYAEGSIWLPEGWDPDGLHIEDEDDTEKDADGSEAEADGETLEIGTDNDVRTEDGLEEGEETDTPEDGYYEGAARYAAGLESGTTGSEPDEPEEQDEVEMDVSQTVAQQEEQQPGMAPGAAIETEDGKEAQVQPEGRYVQHSEFVAHDIFDNIAEGTGLSLLGAVNTYVEYIPPKDPVQQPEGTQKQAEPEGPNMAALRAELRQMDKADLEKQVEAPSR